MPSSRHRFALWDDIPKTTHGTLSLSNIPTIVVQRIIHFFASMFYISMYLLHNLVKPMTRSLLGLAPLAVTLVKYALSPLFIIILAMCMPLVGVSVLVAAQLEPDMSLPGAVRTVREALGECWSECIQRSYPGLVGAQEAEIAPLAVSRFLPLAADDPGLKVCLDPLEKNPGRAEETGEGRTNKFWRERHISEYPASELGGAKGKVPELRKKSRLAVELTPPGKSRI